MKLKLSHSERKILLKCSSCHIKTRRYLQYLSVVLYLIMFVPLQVEQMSIELEDAKTKVAQFQKQCEEFLVVIVQQKRDADEQQKVTTRY